MSKTEKMSQAVGDAHYIKANKIDVLCYALMVLAKGTRYKQDVIEIIQGCNPEYLKEDN